MIQSIPSKATYPLRQQILRPHQSIEDCAYSLDQEPDSYHVGYYQGEQLIGVGSVHREPLPHSPHPQTWRLRGMAVIESAQGQGIGGQILNALIQYAAKQSTPGTIWCNGRVPATSFYQRHGFTPIGEVFELPQIGPHLVFVRPLTDQDQEIS